ncbi:hypothetical protein HPB47_018215 [Ixodes persulcatus]|uniref:Uncharacterized protein n=1 Tax=Ixodes persulcatus TaxID=34615 RepID=A0AC60QLC1_IXOPE|nr:hypothetical protein HPB47_018215 [Ixodes persulcatus]
MEAVRPPSSPLKRKGAAASTSSEPPSTRAKDTESPFPEQTELSSAAATPCSGIPPPRGSPCPGIPPLSGSLSPSGEAAAAAGSSPQSQKGDDDDSDVEIIAWCPKRSPPQVIVLDDSDDDSEDSEDSDLLCGCPECCSLEV